MSISFGTVLIICALLASMTLASNRGDRIVPLVALVACAIQALIAFGILTLSIGFRMDIILPAVLFVTGAICWSRSTSKSGTTAGTLLTAIGALELAMSLRLLD